MDFQILVNVGNQTFPIYINDNFTISKVKYLLLKKLKTHNKSNLDISNLYLTHSGKLLNDTNIISDYNISSNTLIFAQFKLRGGILGSIIKKVIKMIFSFLKPIARPLYDIILAVVSIVELLVALIEMLPNLVEAAISIFNPTKLIDDILYGSTQGINMVMQAFLDSMDTSSIESDESENSGPFGISKESKRVCVPPTMVNIIFLILCPPLALFLQNGIKGFFQVIVCSLLTLKAYYFPGLIYAALHILC